MLYLMPFKIINKIDGITEMFPQITDDGQTD